MVPPKRKKSKPFFRKCNAVNYHGLRDFQCRGFYSSAQERDGNPADKRGGAERRSRNQRSADIRDALSLALDNAGNNNAAKIPMIAMTTSTSISVNAPCFGDDFMQNSFYREPREIHETKHLTEAPLRFRVVRIFWGDTESHRVTGGP